MREKLEHLKKRIKDIGPLAVAFSGGVDSVFLLNVAHEILKSNVMAVMIKSAVVPAREFDLAIKYAEHIGVGLRIVIFDEMKISHFSQNPPDRCYYCKKALFSQILSISGKEGFRFVADGSNVDDLKDARPGMKALKELLVVSPLMDAGFGKSDIRRLSREMGLPAWDTPSSACLASRIPYGQEITRAKLKMVENAEQFLMDMGLKQVRVRHHGDIARIEVAQDELQKMLHPDVMDLATCKLKAMGFSYVTLDMQGYRTGSLNETVGSATQHSAFETL